MITTLAVAVLVGCASLGVFFYAVHARWFSRLKNGFLVTLILAVAGSGALTASLLGIWGADISKQILFHEIVTELGNVGEMVESNLAQEIEGATTELSQYSDDVSGVLSRDKRGQLDTTLTHMTQLNHRFLQINAFDSAGELIEATNAFDKNGKLIEAATQGNVADPVNLVAVAYAREGKNFISDAYESPAFNKYILYIAVPIHDAKSAVIGVLTARYDLQEEMVSLINTTRFDGDGYAVIAEDGGKILAHPDRKRINEDISSYPAFQHGLAGETGWVAARNKAGQTRLMGYRPIDSPATVNPKSWVLMTEIDNAKAMAPIRALELRFLLGTIVLTMLCVLIAHRVSSSIKKPLGELGQFVRKVQNGELSARVTAVGPDEIGQLGKAMNDMVQGLEERDRVKEVFGRYVATQVSDKILKGEINLGGESRRCTILFSDIRNFTEMSEQMAPAQVVSFLNDYFSEMVEAVFEQRGVLDKFIGDGMMAVFGSMEEMPDHPRRAVLAALRMKALVAKINGDRSMQGKPPIGIGIGIHTDDVIVGNIGSRKRLEYTVVGDGVNTTSRVESLNKEFGTTILITETTYEAVKDEFECRHMPEAKIRGKSKALAFYEVVSMKAH
jgi:class 3 adenylate cyclase